MTKTWVTGSTTLTLAKSRNRLNWYTTQSCAKTLSAMTAYVNPGAPPPDCAPGLSRAGQPIQQQRWHSHRISRPQSHSFLPNSAEVCCSPSKPSQPPGTGIRYLQHHLICQMLRYIIGYHQCTEFIQWFHVKWKWRKHWISRADGGTYLPRMLSSEMNPGERMAGHYVIILILWTDSERCHDQWYQKRSRSDKDGCVTAIPFTPEIIQKHNIYCFWILTEKNSLHPRSSEAVAQTLSQPPSPQKGS